MPRIDNSDPDYVSYALDNGWLEPVEEILAPSLIVSWEMGEEPDNALEPFDLCEWCAEEHGLTYPECQIDHPSYNDDTYLCRSCGCTLDEDLDA